MINDTSRRANREKRFPVGADDERASVQVCEAERSFSFNVRSRRDVIMCRETNYELRFMATGSDDTLAFNYLSVILVFILKSGMMPSQTFQHSVNVSFDAEHGRVAPYGRG